MSQLLPERRSTIAPERWEPLSELEQVTQRMRRMLDQTFGGFGWPSPLLTEGAGWSPLVDIEERDDAYVLEAELPGVKRERVGPDISSTASGSRTRSTPRRSTRASTRASSPSASRSRSARSARRSRSRRSETRALRLPVAYACTKPATG